jgi:hypothetical protein
MAPADVLVASPVNGLVGLEMCSATPPESLKSPHTPRLLQSAGLRALEQVAADETEQPAETVPSPTLKTSPAAAKRKRQSQSPTTSGKQRSWLPCDQRNGSSTPCVVVMANSRNSGQ